MKQVIFSTAVALALSLAGCGQKRAPENTGNNTSEMSNPDNMTPPADNTTTPLNSTDDNPAGRDKGTGNIGIIDPEAAPDSKTIDSNSVDAIRKKEKGGQ